MNGVPMQEDIHHYLPAYCAGSLPEHLHRDVEEAILASPELLAEAMELSLVQERLLEVRRQIDEEAASR